MIRFIKRMFAAFSVGLVLCLWILQNTPSVKTSISKHLITFLEREWDTRITIGTAKINFFTCSLYFENGSLQSNKHKLCQWGFEQCKIYVSPWQLLFNKQINLDLAFNNLKGKSSFSSQQIDLVDHLFDIFTPKSLDLDIAISSLALNNVDLDLVRTQETYSLHVPCSLKLQRDALQRTNSLHWHGALNMTQASIIRNNQLLAHKISGSIELDRDIKTEIWSFKPLVECMSPLLKEDTTYTISGTWDKDQQTFSVHDENKEITLTGNLKQKTTIALKGSMPAAFLHMLASGQQTQNSGLHGTCIIDLDLMHAHACLTSTGTLFFKNLSYGTFSLPLLGFDFNNSSNASSEAQIKGSCQWDFNQQKGTLRLANTASITPTSIDDITPSFMLQADDLNITLTLDSNGKLAGTYVCTLTNPATEKRFSHRGALLLGKKTFGLNGKTSRGSYNLHAILDPHPYITSWRYTVGNKDLVNFSSDLHNKFLLKGTCDWSLIRSFLHQRTRHLLFGSECSFALTLDQSHSSLKQGTCSLNHGTFYIPEFHNLIHTFNTNFTLDLQAQKFTLSDLKIDLSKGYAQCPHATFIWDNDYNVHLVHIPLQIDDLFINWKRDFYGSVHGNLLLNKLPGHDTLLAGILILKKALIKETFFNKDETSALAEPLNGSLTRYPFPCGLHIKLMTEKPIKAQMANLDAEASFNLMLMATPNKDYGTVPYLTGGISIKNGTLKILNNKLAIERGKIQFIKNQLHDPLIELTAKNRINKYLVNLHVSGSLEKPSILLESTPDLTEEQIIGLLLAGSEHATLQSDLPAMLLQNLDALIWSNKKRTRTTAIFDGLTKTFKYVQITPNLSDSSGKQGLMKGSLSLNLSDQLRAQIHKNLTTQRNDFSAQLEYFLSDNINIKVVQDQRDKRGESGAEIEMRLTL